MVQRKMKSLNARNGVVHGLLNQIRRHPVEKNHIKISLVQVFNTRYHPYLTMQLKKTLQIFESKTKDISEKFNFTLVFS